MTLETALAAAFAAALVMSLGSFAAALVERIGRRAVLVVLGALALVAAGAWIAFALAPDVDLAVTAGGLTACLAVQGGALVALRAAARRRRIDAEIKRAQETLSSLIERETSERAGELERTLARARADSLSRLTEEERRIAEQRRLAVTEREERGREELAESLASVQRQVERRLAEWSEDLGRVQQSLAAELAGLLERQRSLLEDVETRTRADTERIAAESEEQRAALTRMRADLGRAVEEAAATASEELEGHAAERRRALHEVGERLRRREQSLREQIEREETEAVRRIQAGFAEVERRQVEALERVVSRAAASYADAAAQQFAEQIKSAREDAARRLARELDRAVASFERQAASVLGDRLAHVSEAGGQRLERRFSQLTASLDRQREEALAVLERRFAEVEGELRSRLAALVSDVDAERAVLEARLSELARRVDDTFARAR